MMEEQSRFWAALCDADKRPFAVELDSPAGPDVSRFMAGARELQRHGAELITVADCPMGRVRADAGIMACKLRRELGMESLPHMSCRDRNWIAVQSLLFGFVAEGVENMLLVTGDPVPPEYRDEAHGVYHGFLTQPVLSPQALENLQAARENLRGKLLGGVMPIVSQRNALFLQREVSGVAVDPRIVSLYEGADREKGEALAVEISAEYASRMAASVDGYYLMTPFGRTALVCRIMDTIRKG